MTKHPEQWQEVTEGYSKENARDGDILVCDGNGCTGHVLIVANGADGKLKRVEASYAEGDPSRCTVGRVTGDFKGLGHGYRAWRSTNNPAYNQNCICQVGQQNQEQANGIADGGYSSVEEANKAVMEPYKKMGNRITKYNAVNVGCRGGITSEL